MTAVTARDDVGTSEEAELALARAGEHDAFASLVTVSGELVRVAESLEPR
jgi:hypothetical protein